MDQTLQSIFQLGFQDYAERHYLPLYYHKAASHIMSCRTAVLGGHSLYCEDGHLNGVWYNSCKHRACPQCSGIGLHRWVAQQQQLLLNCRHIHIVFPLAHEYLDHFRLNTERMINLMFQAARDSLYELLRDDPEKKYLDAQPGFIMGLHTWSRDNSLHPHLHCILTEGGFNGEHWVKPKGSVLLPARVLRAKYQGKLNDFIRQAARRGPWRYPQNQGYQQLVNLSNKLGRKKWHLYIKDHFKYTAPLLKYLVNYLKGGPLKNAQITAVHRDQVTFRYYPHRSNPDGRKEHPAYRTESMEAFLNLYLQHIPPPGSRRVRHYGLYANTQRDALNRARAELGQPPTPTTHERSEITWIDFLRNFADGAEKTRCKRCSKSLTVLKPLPQIPLYELLERLRAPP